MAIPYLQSGPAHRGLPRCARNDVVFCTPSFRSRRREGQEAKRCRAESSSPFCTLPATNPFTNTQFSSVLKASNLNFRPLLTNNTTNFIKMYTLYINSIELVVIIKTIIYICRRDKKIQRKTVLKAPENATRPNHQPRLCCLSNAN